MATFGYTGYSGGGSTKDLAAYVYGIKVPLPEDGQVTSITVYLDSPVDGGATAGLVGDDGTDGAPGTLLGDTDEVIINGPGWYTFTLDSPLDLLAGDYYLCVHGENVAGIVFHYTFEGVYEVYRRFNGYTSGTIAVPDGVFNSGYHMAIYATYTPASGGVTKTVTDSATVVDSADLSTLMLSTETALANETFDLAAGLALTDSAVATDDPPGVSVLQQIVEAASVVDLIPGLSAVITVGESAQGSDSVAPVAGMLASDSAGIVEALGLSVSIVASDVGNASDLTSLITESIKLVTDSASASDTTSVSVNVTAVDSVAANDQSVVTVTVSAADSVSAAEQLNLITDTLKSVSEVASVVDQVGLSSFLQVSDIASVTDQPSVAVVLQIADSASVVDSVSKLEQLIKSVTDVASVTEGLSVSVQLADTDSAVAVDSTVLSGIFAVLDSASASDVVIRYIPGTTKIASISFNLKTRSIEAALKSRGIAFKLN
ncbi:MAG: hypothetical protein KZQ93_15840 [Candidatus Thiodiazotropha sp. (ex Monitilora ramsayi)]|nr:hypothetical protein [Candidatus Thiodiazotropha sp. (ex Monitilora ramsayi)]